MKIFDSKYLLRAFLILLSISTISVLGCENKPGRNPNEDRDIKKHKNSIDHTRGPQRSISTHEIDDAKIRKRFFKSEPKYSHSSHALPSTSASITNKPKSRTSLLSFSAGPRTPAGIEEAPLSLAAVRYGGRGRAHCERCKREMVPRHLCQRCRREIETQTVPARLPKTCPTCFRPIGVAPPTKTCMNCAKYNIPCVQSHGRTIPTCLPRTSPCLPRTSPCLPRTSPCLPRRSPCLPRTKITKIRCNDPLLCNKCVGETQQIKPVDGKTGEEIKEPASPLKITYGSFYSRCKRRMYRPYRCKVTPVYCHDYDYDNCAQNTSCYPSTSCGYAIPVTVSRVRRKLSCRDPYCSEGPCGN